MFVPVLDSKIVGSVICDFRKRKGISQEVLSGLADIGRTHLSAIERGERKPTLETLYRLCNALDVKMTDVVKEIETRIDSQNK
jgi:transcriptional regulator with XRE-family HTH domain